MRLKFMKNAWLQWKNRGVNLNSRVIRLFSNNLYFNDYFDTIRIK